MNETLKQFPDLELNFSRALPEDKNARILDFGCGDGRVLRFLHAKGYRNLTGADIYPDNWNELAHLNANLIPIKDSKEFLISQNEKFDFIVVKDVIYYFNNDNVIEITSLLKNALKPGGKIIFEIFNGSLMTGPYIKYKDVGIKLILTERSLKQIIDYSGLKLESIYGSNQRPRTAKGWIFYAMNKIWCLQLRLIYFLERGLEEQNPKILNRKILATATR